VWFVWVNREENKNAMAGADSNRALFVICKNVEWWSKDPTNESFPKDKFA